jgi:hypothetical protein
LKSLYVLQVRTCRLPDLKRKLLARMNTAQDMHMNPVGPPPVRILRTLFAV